jgi:hypothetical protein
MKEYKTRFIPQADAWKIINYCHLARTALSGKECTRYTRMLWAAKEYAKENTAVSASGAYKDLDCLLA